jgi:hypothetical protein
MGYDLSHGENKESGAAGMSGSKLVTCAECGAMAPLETARAEWWELSTPMTAERPRRARRLCSVTCLSDFAAALRLDYESYLSRLSAEAEPAPAVTITQTVEVEAKPRKRRWLRGE